MVPESYYILSAMTSAAMTPPPDYEPLARMVVHSLSAHLIDTGSINYKTAYAIAEEASTTEVQQSGAVAIVDDAKSKERARTRSAERSARYAGRKAAIEKERAFQSGNLYLDKYLHGWLDSRVGAVPKGCTCDECEHTRQYQRSIERKLHEAVKMILATFQEAGQMRWTWYLLNRTIKFGNGTAEVRWGLATASQHEERRDYLIKHAMGTLESAAQHQAALDTLSKARVQNLDGAVAKGFAS